MYKLFGKRLFDIVATLIGGVLLLPFIAMVIVWIKLSSKGPLIYAQKRVSKDFKEFNLYKFRSMIIDADKAGQSVTSVSDPRITKIGKFLRKTKIDEIPQLINVIKGDMSLVGPRPNVASETNLYTTLEKKLLSVKPGITDFSSIVFSDEGEILKDKDDIDLSYNQLIRPWKSRLGLIYIEKRSMLLDLKLIFYTVVVVISKKIALNWVSAQLNRMKVDANVVSISKRDVDLYPSPPPGSDHIVNR